MDRPKGIKFLTRADNFRFLLQKKTNFGFALPLLLGGRGGYFSWRTAVG
jgi:hypothetical protein